MIFKIKTARAKCSQRKNLSFARVKYKGHHFKNKLQIFNYTTICDNF